MDLLQQLKKEVADLRKLVATIIGPDGKLILPIMDKEQEAALKKFMAGTVKEGEVKDAILTLIPLGNGATTSPVGGGAVPVPATGSLLDASWLTPFDLKGRSSKHQLIDVVKGDRFTAVVDVKSTNGGGVGANLVKPENNQGAAKYEPLKLIGKNTFTLTAEVTGKVYFEVQANSSDTTISSASLTKV